MKRRRQAIQGLCLLLISGCGHDKSHLRASSAPVQHQPDAARDRAPVAAPEREDGMTVSGGLGELDEQGVDARVRTQMEEVNRCYRDAVSRRWYLSGRMELKLRIGTDGSVRSLAVVESLGSYEMERCVSRVIARLSFPPPRGGEAEFLYPVEFSHARAGVESWPAGRVAPDMARPSRDVDSCKARAKWGARAARPLRVTLYIGPGGRVASAGLAADDPIDEQLASCLISRAYAWRFEDPLGRLIKASYAFD